MAKNIKLKVDELTVSFRTNQGMVRAVRGVTFDLYEGETLAIVGESGSGKSVSSRAIMGILAGNGVIDKGSIIYEGEDLTQVSEEHFHELRGNKIGMIFQDPMSSLNPIMKIGKQITEGMILNGKRLEERYKKLFNDERTAYESLLKTIKRNKQSVKTLKETLNAQFKAQTEETIDPITKEDIASQVGELKAKVNAENNGLKAQLPEAKAKYSAAKKEAKRITTEEWKAEQAKYKPLIAAQKEESKKVVLDFDFKGKMEALKAEMNKQLETAEEEQKRQVRQEFNAKLKELRAEYREVRRIERNKVIAVQEELARFKKVTKREAYERAIEVMTEVGIPEPEKRIVQYPFQFSGGMRQRIVIAIALTASPDILICDEPTTALDVTIQAQILELINDLKKERNLSVIFITHDLGVVANMADRIGVMYAGKLVEVGTAEDVFYDPRHPYTWALLSSMPDLDSKERLTAIPGTPPNMLFPPKGDAFADRSKYAMKIDFEEQPPMFKVNDTHSAATWLLHKDAPKVEMPKIIKDRIARMTAGGAE
jgi:oligopeptide transport system ATP-binding protein